MVSEFSKFPKKKLHLVEQMLNKYLVEQIFFAYFLNIFRTVVAIYIFAMIAFANGSHKQKGSRAATTEFEIEDRPVHVGRY